MPIFVFMWHYKNQVIQSIEQVPEGAFGFIYRITNKSKEARGEEPYIYLGKKQIFSEITKKLGKKEIAALEDRRRSKKRKIVKESNWLDYNGSCIPLLEDIANGDEIYKEILLFTYSKMENTYEEIKHLFINLVIEKEEYYNNTISNHFYKGNIGKSKNSENL